MRRWMFLVLLPFLFGVTVLNDDAGWCWFQDERAIWAAGKLIAGSVSDGRGGLARRGNIEVNALDPAAGAVSRFILHPRLERDDHDAPSLLELPDGRILAVYTGHSIDSRVRSRVSLKPGDISAWSDEVVFTPPDREPTSYTHLFRLADENGRIYNFYRGKGWDPNVMTSDDEGKTWAYAGQVATGPGRPYARYASDNRDTVHFILTDQHPRDFDNSLYHGYLRGGKLYDSFGKQVGDLDHPPEPNAYTVIFAGKPDAVAWGSDINLDDLGRPYVTYSVQIDGARKPKGAGGMDHRYRYAWFDGAWQDHEVAYAGTRIYAGEDDYTGLICLAPWALNTVYFSTNADPKTGKPLVSGADGKRHWELFKATTRDGGATWGFEEVTKDSTQDNIRPNAPIGGPAGGALIWLRGHMKAYHNYRLEMVAQVPAP